MKRASAIAGLLVFVVQAFGDAPLDLPSRVERWSQNRQHVAIADPNKNVITVYQAKGPSREELWRRDGWGRVFDIADDGEHLVVCYSGLKLLPLNYETSWTMLSFCKRKVLFRKWSVADLIPDLSKLERTVSHFIGVTALDLTRKVSTRSRPSTGASCGSMFARASSPNRGAPLFNRQKKTGEPETGHKHYNG